MSNDAPKPATAADEPIPTFAWITLTILLLQFARRALCEAIAAREAAAR